MTSSAEVMVWYVEVNDSHPVVLSDEERRRADKFRAAEDARRFAAGRSLLRHVISSYTGVSPHDVRLVTGRNGKPAPADGNIHFSLSRSGGIVAVAVTRWREVGLDVEKLDLRFDMDDIVRSYYSHAEAAYIDTLQVHEKRVAFFRLWARKEALLKATGEGLGGLSPEVDVLDKEIMTRGGVKWRLYDLDIATGYAASLAVESDGARVSVSRYHFS